MSEDNVSRLPVSETEALEKRLVAAKARKAHVQEGRLKREEANALREEVERQEQAAVDAEALDKAEVEHGAKKIATVQTEMGLIILRRPHPMHFKRFRDKGANGTEELEKLVAPCLVYPDRGKFNAILEEEPAALDRCADRVVTLAGFRAKEVAGK